MNKFITVGIAAMLAVTSPTFADEPKYFYDSGEAMWRVTGYYPQDGSGYGCVARTDWDDNSYVILVHDIDNSELGFVIEYNSIKFKGDNGDEFEGNFVFEKKNGAKKVLRMSYTRHDEHHLSIPHIDPSKFIEPFAAYDSLTIFSHEGVGFKINLRGSGEAISHMSKCWDESKKLRNIQNM